MLIALLFNAAASAQALFSCNCAPAGDGQQGEEDDDMMNDDEQEAEQEEEEESDFTEDEEDRDVRWTNCP